MTLALTEADLRELPEGLYTFKVTVTDYFNSQATTSIRTVLQQTGTQPMVDLQVPSSVVLSAGATLDATVQASTVCGSSSVVFTWTAGSTTFATQRRSGLFMSQAQLVAAGARPGGALTVSVTAAFSNSPRNNFTNTRTVNILGDPLVASLRGSPSGMVGVNSVLTFTAAASNDPSDPSNVFDAMRFAWSCVREDEPLSSCFTVRGYQGVRNGSTWTIQASQLVPMVHTTIIVNVAKGSGTSLRTASASQRILLNQQRTFAVSMSPSCGINLQTGVPNVCGTDVSSITPVSDTSLKLKSCSKQVPANVLGKNAVGLQR